MRILIGHPGPQFSVADCYQGWAEALKSLGQQVFSYNLDDRLLFYDAAMVEIEGVKDAEGRPALRKALTRQQAVQLAANGLLSAAYQCWPDVIFLVSAFFTPSYMLEIMRERRHKIVLLHTESPYQDGEQLERAQFADVNLLNDPVNIDRYRELDGRAEYMPHAYRPSVHYPPPRGQVKKHDLCFVGTGFPSRQRFFEAMDLAGLEVLLAGPWFGLPEDSPLRDVTDFDPEGCVSNEETAAIYRDSRCGINFYRRESEDAHEGEGWAVGPREVEMAATGLWFPRDPRPESDELFPMLPAFSSPEEAGDLVRWAISHEAEREKAAMAAREAIADRTFSNHAKSLLAMLDT
jgi:spore maturation protein CgeB